MYSMNLNVNSIFKAATHSTDLTVMQHNSAYTACLDLLSLSWPDHGFATKCSNLNIFQSCHSWVGAVWVAFTRNMQWLWAHLWIQTKQNELIFTQVPLLIHPTLMNTIQTLSKSPIYQKIMQCTFHQFHDKLPFLFPFWKGSGYWLRERQNIVKMHIWLVLVWLVYPLQQRETITRQLPHKPVCSKTTWNTEASFHFM